MAISTDGTVRGTLRAGAARIVITPPVGVELAGYNFGPSTGVLDDLEAQVLVLQGDGEPIAIVTIDLLVGLVGMAQRAMRDAPAAR